MYEPINPRLRTLLFGLGLVTMSLLGLWLYPRVLGLYYQSRGGELVQQVFKSDGTLVHGIACEKPPLTNESARIQLDQAILQIQKAIEFNSEMAKAYLILGRAYCLLGEPDMAIEAYSVFTELRPENPLGHLELGFAYEAACQKNEGQSMMKDDKSIAYSLCMDSDQEARIIDEWKKAGVNTSQLMEEGKRAFLNQQYHQAVRWYTRAAATNSDLPPSSLFQWSVAAVIDGSPLPQTNASDTVEIRRISDITTIEAEEFYWLLEDLSRNLNYGDKLKEGIMWWSGTAVTFLEIPERGTYDISIRVKDTPGPLSFQIEQDFVPIARFRLSEGDNTWQELEVTTEMPAGIHIVGIHFLDDIGDLVFDWIKVREYRISTVGQ
jgi:tetratricopeptide (TPR) repeat protein